MTGHLYVPAYENRPGIPASLSSSLIQDLLKQQMGFKGLIVTDALNMQGVAKHFKPGEMEVMAIQAGNDILLFSENIPVAIEAIKEAVQRGDLNMSDIDKSCKKILMAKSLSITVPIVFCKSYEDFEKRNIGALLMLIRTEKLETIAQLEKAV
jgi:beta-glucosidase-like glycosyl hydrolase